MPNRLTYYVLHTTNKNPMTYLDRCANQCEFEDRLYLAQALLLAFSSSH